MQEESERGKAFRYLDQTHNVRYDKSEESGNFQVVSFQVDTSLVARFFF